jgi:hypothetical protein
MDVILRHNKLDLHVMMPDQQLYKRWKAAFLNFIRMKLPNIIPQLVMHKSRALIAHKNS